MESELNRGRFTSIAIRGGGGSILRIELSHSRRVCLNADEQSSQQRALSLVVFTRQADSRVFRHMVMARLAQTGN